MGQKINPNMSHLLKEYCNLFASDIQRGTSKNTRPELSPTLVLSFVLEFLLRRFQI